MKRRNNSQDNCNDIRNLLREKIDDIYLDISNTMRITGILLVVFGVALLISGYLKNIIHLKPPI